MSQPVGVGEISTIRMIERSPEFEDKIVDLTKLGLTPLQARIFVNLHRLGPTTARNISKFSNVNRVDVYRVLRELSKRGLVEVNLGNPAVYNSVDPKLVLQILLSEIEDRVRELKTRSEGLITWLSSLKAVSEASEERLENPFFRLLSGHQILNRCIRMFDGASVGILRILPGGSLPLHFQEGFFEHYEDCVSRGVKIRIITEITKRNIYEAEEFSKITEIRHSNDVSTSLKYVVADDWEVMVMLNSPIMSARGATAFVSNNQGLIKGFKLDFEALWRRSQDAVSRAKELTASYSKA